MARERPVALIHRISRPINVDYVAATEIQVLDTKSIGRIEFFLRPPCWCKQMLLRDAMARLIARSRFKVNGLSSSNSIRSKNKFIGNYFEPDRRTDLTPYVGMLNDHRKRIIDHSHRYLDNFEICIPPGFLLPPIFFIRPTVKKVSCPAMEYC